MNSKMAVFAIKVLTWSDSPKKVVEDYIVQWVSKLFIKWEPILWNKGEYWYNWFKIILWNYIDKEWLVLAIKALQNLPTIFKKKYEIIVIIAFEKDNSNEELVIENNDLKLLYSLWCEINIYYE